MGRIEHTLLDEEQGLIPNRPKTIACNPTIPQKVPNVSIYGKGSEPSRLESSDPMREADAPSTGTVTVLSVQVCPPHRGKLWSHHRRSCARQRGRKAKGNARSGVRKAKAALSEDESVQRGQRQYKGRCPCVRMHGAPATSAGTPRRLRAQEPRPATSIKAGAPASPARGLIPFRFIDGIMRACQRYTTHA